MKNLKYFLLTFFSVLLVSFQANAQYVTGYSDLNDSDVTKALKSHITYLSSADLEGRKAGSEGEKAAADYIRTCLESYAVELLSGRGFVRHIHAGRRYVDIQECCRRGSGVR